MTKRRASLMIFLLLAAGLIMTTPALAEAVYVQVPTIQGESTEATHLNWIVAYSLDHDLDVPIVSGTPGIANLSHVTVLKGNDKATPLLHDAAVKNTIFNTGSVFVEVCRTSPSLQCYYRIELINAEVVGEHLTGNSCIDPSSCTPNVVESVDFVYSRIKWRYTPFVSGKAGTPIEKCWDLSTHTPC